MYFLIICVTALQVASGRAEAEETSVSQAFREDFFVRKIVIDPPTELMSVTYFNTPIYLGTRVQPLQTLTQPQVSYEADANTRYTLMMMGPDLPPSIGPPPLSQLVHWLVVNISGKNVSSGYNVATYFPPVPYPDGFPYIFLLFKQIGLLDTSKIPNQSFILSRPNFHYYKFAEKYNLVGPIAGNFMHESYLEIVSQVAGAVIGALG